VGDTARVRRIQDIQELEADEEIAVMVNNFCRSGSSSFQVVGGYDRTRAARAKKLAAPILLSSHGFFFFFFFFFYLFFLHLFQKLLLVGGLGSGFVPWSLIKDMFM
jgi:hypothetical protein